MTTINVALRKPEGVHFVPATIKKIFVMFGEEFAIHRPITYGNVEAKKGWRVSHIKSGFYVVGSDSASETIKAITDKAIATLTHYGEDATKRAIRMAIPTAGE